MDRVFPLLEHFVIIRVNRVYLLSDLNRTWFFEVLLSYRVEYGIRQSFLSSDPEVWIELQHAPDQRYYLGAGLWEHAVKLVAVLFLTDHVHVVNGRVVCYERFIVSFWRAKNATNVLHLVFGAYVKLDVVIVVRATFLLLLLRHRGERIAGLSWQQYPILASFVW